MGAFLSILGKNDNVLLILLTPLKSKFVVKSEEIKYETNQDRWEYFNEDASLSEFLEMPPVARKYYSFVLISPHFIL